MPAKWTALADNVHPHVQVWFPPTDCPPPALASIETLDFISARGIDHSRYPLLLLAMDELWRPHWFLKGGIHIQKFWQSYRGPCFCCSWFRGRASLHLVWFVLSCFLIFVVFDSGESFGIIALKVDFIFVSHIFSPYPLSPRKCQSCSDGQVKAWAQWWFGECLFVHHLEILTDFMEICL